MAFKMNGWSAFTKKDKEYIPQSQRKDKEYEPQTKTRGYKSQIKKGHHTHPDMMPQTEIDKADVSRLEGEIEGIFDNEYMEAKERGDKSAIKRYEQDMLKLKRELKRRGVDYTHVDMSAFKKTDPPPASDEVDENKEAYKRFTSKVITANPQFEEVENPFYDESKGGDKMTKQVITDWENPAYDDIRDKFAYNPDMDYSTVETK